MKKIFSFLLLALLLLLLTGCGGFEQALNLDGDTDGYTFITSRFDEPLDLALYFEKYTTARAEEFDLLVIGCDGLAARISGGDLTGCTLVYSKQFAWELRSESHPPSANIKNIAKLAVVSTSDDPRAARFISGDDVQGFTAGQLLLRNSLRALKEEGTSQQGGKSVTVYTTRWRLPLAELFGDGQDAAFCATGFNGKTVYFRTTDNCFLEFGGNQIDLLLADGQRLENLAGVMADPPGFMITEASADALRFLHQDERVMIVELDGLGYSALRLAGSKFAPFLFSLNPKPALACYPPVSSVGLAAMLTGETPDINGVQSRDDREPAAEDLFSKAEKLGKTCAYIEGAHSLIKTSLRPVLSGDDGETFQNALDAAANRPDLMFVHFHGIDEVSHEHGPYSKQVLLKIRELDGYVQSLAESFDGRLIITSDHGQHDEDGVGDHGEFLAQDMIVPYSRR
ncbi:MAG: alkaline phosphatase family protein [Oscillospiraceae bacterium]|nr:alkaline phosphatase family protein [Oscillospiraceae bacterium]